MSRLAYRNALEYGQVVQKTPMVNRTFRISPAEVEQIDQLAQRLGVRPSDVIRDAIALYVRNAKRRNGGPTA